MARGQVGLSNNGRDRNLVMFAKIDSLDVSLSPFLWTFEQEVHRVEIVLRSWYDWSSW